MTRDRYLSEELMNERLLEEVRENVRGGFEFVVGKPKYRSVAARVYVALASGWGLTSLEAAKLLHISEANFRDWKADVVETVDAECMEKISCLMGIYKYLCILYSGHIDRVEAWLQRENHSEHFGGRTPYDILLKLGIKAFHSIRRDLASKTV